MRHHSVAGEPANAPRPPQRRLTIPNTTVDPGYLDEQATLELHAVEQPVADAEEVDLEREMIAPP